MPDTSGLLSQVYMTIAGADASERFVRDTIEVSVESSLHLPDVAVIVLKDASLQWIDDASLVPGTAITIATKAGSSSQVQFDGEIVELEPDFGAGVQRLIVRAFDRLHRLSRGRHVRTFLNVSDSDLVRTIASEVGLQASIDPTPQTYPYVLQSNETNARFLQRRAAALGYILFVRGKTLHCEQLRSEGATVELAWGATLSEFRPRMATGEQVDGVTVRGWDPVTKQALTGQASTGRGVPQVGLRNGGEIAHQAFNVAAQCLVADRPVRTQTDADALAQAVVDRIAGRFIEAEGSCGGNPAIVAGVAVHITAVGERFSGTYTVTRATHNYGAAQGYTTHFSISGQSASNLFSLLAPDSDGAAGTGTGLAVGIVTDNQDPDGQGRVKVMYPWLSDDHSSHWARVAVPGGGDGRGIEFLPEINDEVVVGFELGDMEYPYVLGGLWNGRDAPPQTNSQVVSGGHIQRRIIRSRAGHCITLDDSDGGGGVTIVDKNGNTITLDSGANKLTITVQGDLSLEAKGAVKITGKGVSVDGGSGAVDVKGMGVSLDAGSGAFEGKGMGATLDGGGGTVDLSGSTINLN